MLGIAKARLSLVVQSSASHVCQRDKDTDTTPQDAAGNDSDHLDTDVSAEPVSRASASVRWEFALVEVPLFDGDPLRTEGWCAQVEKSYNEHFLRDISPSACLTLGRKRLSPAVRDAVIGHSIIESWDQLKSLLLKAYPASLGRRNLMRELMAEPPQRYQAGTMLQAINLAQLDWEVCPHLIEFILAALMARLPLATRTFADLYPDGDPVTQFDRLREVVDNACRQLPVPSWIDPPRGTAAFAAVPTAAPPPPPAPSALAPATTTQGASSGSTGSTVPQRTYEAMRRKNRKLQEELAAYKSRSNALPPPPSSFPSSQ